VRQLSFTEAHHVSSLEPLMPSAFFHQLGLDNRTAG
jgi:hypothetical protein